jgi:diguanylate cyclase (GGDEF)-like protein
MCVLIDLGNVTLVVLLTLCGVLGLLALASPKAFATVVSYASRLTFRRTQTRKKNLWFHIDTLVFAHARWFGLLLIATVGWVWLIVWHGSEACPKALPMTIIAVALMMGLVALRHIMWQSLQIKTHQAEAHVDPLTGLANRRAFDQELSRRLAQHHRHGASCCLLIIDIDHFKPFNDEFGHLLGDAILKEVADTLKTRAREMDIVARLGGDEFAVLLPDSTLETASHAAERFRSSIGDRPLLCEGHEYTLTVSIGLAEAQLDDDTISLLKRADSALYAAKDAGRNCSFRQGVPEPAGPTPCKRQEGQPLNSQVAEAEEIREPVAIDED